MPKSFEEKKRLQLSKKVRMLRRGAEDEIK
jgi:hypothetical protein